MAKKLRNMSFYQKIKADNSSVGLVPRKLQRVTLAVEFGFIFLQQLH